MIQKKRGGEQEAGEVSHWLEDTATSEVCRQTARWTARKYFFQGDGSGTAVVPPLDQEAFSASSPCWAMFCLCDTEGSPVLQARTRLLLGVREGQGATV